MDPALESRVEDDTLVDLNRSESIDLLGECQNAMENAVIIYDTGSQEQQIIKFVSDPESNSQMAINTEDPDNIITLHASSEDNVNSSNAIDTNLGEPLQHEEPEIDSDDDETIATFITSSGQQLALYAVEDSEEVFAVAVYDETGAPPTNFHFLLKADVERLIGEGAVKTVKKPSAMKKNVAATDSNNVKEETSKKIKLEVDEVESIEKTIKKEIKEDILETIVETIEIGPADYNDLDNLPEKEVNNQTINNNETVVLKQSPKVSHPDPTCTTKIVQNTTSSPIKFDETSFASSKPAAAKMKPTIPVSQTKIIQSRVSSPSKIGQTTLLSPVKRNPTAQTKITRVLGLSTTPKIVQTPSRVDKKIVPKTEQLSPKRLMKTVQSSPFSSKKLVQQTPSKITKILPKATQSQYSNIKEDNKVTYMVTQNNKSYAFETTEDFDSDVEILEQSTVQYILCDESHSDSELTFDELQKSIQGFTSNKSNQHNQLKSKTSYTPKYNRKKETFLKYTPTKLIKSSPVVVLQRDSTVSLLNKSPKKSRTKNNILQCHRKIKKEVEDPSYDFPFADYSFNTTDDQVGNETVKVVKRCRKQQLTVVNRTDSEIIIQPAAMFSETEDEPVVVKKRGRRKKRVSPDPDYNPNRPAQKKNKKYNRSVELIEIDVDENDSLNRTKSKGSSDKENDDVYVVPEVSDASAEDEDVPVITQKKKPIKLAKPMMKCNHCERNFRKRKVLERHLPVCPKVPGNAQKIEESKKLLGIQKRFKCKNCEESFDVALTLARHVRAAHSPRKKAKQIISRDDRSSTTEMDSAREDDDDEEEDEESEPEFEPKRRGRPPSKNVDTKQISQSSMVQKWDSSYEPKKRGPGRPPLKKRSIVPRAEDSSAASPSLSKETDDKSSSPTVQSLKLESSNEPTPEPRKRGRPPYKKNLPKERSVTPSMEDEPSKVSSTPLQPIKKRGRPPSKISRSVSPQNEEKTDTPLQIPKKRGRPSWKNVHQDKASPISTATEKAETSSASPMSRKKSIGESSNDLEDESQKIKEVELTVSEKEEKIEELSDSITEPVLKKRKTSEDEIGDKGNAEESISEPRKRGRPPKDKSLRQLDLTGSDQDEKNGDPKSTNEELPAKKYKKTKDGDTDFEDKQEDKVEISPIAEYKKRGRPFKHQPVKDHKVQDLDASKKEDNLVSLDCLSAGAHDREDQSENLSETFVEPKRRGRPPKDKSSKENKVEDLDEEVKIKSPKVDDADSLTTDKQIDKVEDLEATLEPKKRGRPPKDKFQKVETLDREAKSKILLEDQLRSSESESDETPAKKALVESLSREEKIESFAEFSAEPKTRGASIRKSLDDK